MINFIMEYIKIYKLKITVYLIITFVLIGLSLIYPYIQSLFINGIVYSPSYDFLFKITILILIISLINIILSYFNNLLLVELNNKISFKLSNNVIKQLEKINILYLSKYDSAYLAERINNDCNTLISFFLTNFIKIFSSGFTFLFCLGLLVNNYGVKLMLLIILILPIYPLIYTLLKKTLYNRNLDLVEKQGEFFSILNSIFKTIKSIKIKVLFDEREKKYKEGFSRLIESIISFNKVSYIFFSINNSCNSIFNIIIMFFIGVKIINGEMEIGDFILITSYCNIVVSSIEYYLSLGESYQRTKVAYTRLKEFFDIPVEVNGELEIKEINDITVKNLSFKYYSGNTLIKDFSYVFKKGFIYAITGCNGSGKSTLTNLIIGMLNSNYTGEIYFNNIDIQNINLYSARKKLITFVEQEPFLSNDTIYNNLIFNIDKVDFDLLNKLLEIFNLCDTIELLPDGINSIVNDNIKNLSGGERQKISIINSLMSQANVIVLDEPTAALDICSIKRLNEVLGILKLNKIIIIVSHDEEFYTTCDYIIKI
ncbi:ABC transporter ATP-binding protein [Clostridium perfringens]|uniref:ABC transporter ATP-binding protein n=2 Tax=Clostridium perfringens TaxID=1502 RepID=UPI001C866494|nr:ABC transporter ATP-binding protein [Clostridium perfringens]WFD89303.1 ABC transporter ATP-binding protein [Clostridium perfringens]